MGCWPIRSLCIKRLVPLCLCLCVFLWYRRARFLTRLCFFQLAILAPTLPPGILNFFALNLPDDGCATLVPVTKVVYFLGEDLASDFSILVSGTGGLAFDDDAGGDVFELNSGARFVLWIGC